MIQELKAKLESEKVARRLAIIQELSQVEKDRDTLASQLSQAKQDKDAVVNLSKAELTNALQKQRLIRLLRYKP